MATEIVMPKLGLTMTEGTIVHWFVKEGDQVELDDPVAEISSEKLTSEVLAPESGTIIKILADEGAVIPCKQAMAYVGEAGEKIEAAGKTETAPSQAEESKVDAQPVAAAAPSVSTQTHMNTHDGERLFITPLARKLAAEKGIDIHDVNGTGGNGRITRLDIERYVPSAKAATAQAPAASMEFGAGLTGMRKTIAQRMMTSVQTTAQVTNQRKADITELMKFRKEMKEKVNQPLDQGELSINTLLTKAVVLSLLESPDMNAWYHNGEYIKLDEVHIGMATAVDDGLVVPVIKDAQQMGLSQLGPAIRKVATEARKGTLDGSLYTGSTFTITNLGGLDIEYFTPIINSPEVGILGVGSLQNELEMDENGKVVTKQKLPLSLTYDHQIIDGAPAAEFLSRIAGYLQDPYRLLI